MRVVRKVRNPLAVLRPQQDPASACFADRTEVSPSVEGLRILFPSAAFARLSHVSFPPLLLLHQTGEPRSFSKGHLRGSTTAMAFDLLGRGKRRDLF